MSREQKNLRMEQWARNWIEKKAVEWHSSKKKQGHVVEQLIKAYQKEDQAELIREIHEAVVEGGSTNTPPTSRTHTSNGLTTEASDSAALEEMKQKAADGEPVDPEEYDLDLIKGARGIDKAEIVLAVLRASDQGSWTQEEITDMISEKTTYGSRNVPNNIARECISRMSEHPLRGIKSEMLSSLVRKQTERNWHRKERLNKDEYIDKYGTSLKEYLDVSHEFLTDQYFLSQAESMDQIQKETNLLFAALARSSGNQKKRAQLILVKWIEELAEANLLEKEIGDRTLKNRIVERLNDYSFSLPDNHQDKLERTLGEEIDLSSSELSKYGTSI